jgi:uncharacterized protein YecE (DUF72 family)
MPTATLQAGREAPGMEVFVGTSGWSYGWNAGGNLDWYIQNAGLTAVELNAGFYQFPFRNQVLAWSKKGKGLRWCVKVHRSVTHRHRFNEAARQNWQQFLDLFKPLDPVIGYYLFQAPPSLKETGRLTGFFTGLPWLEKCVLEIRNRNLLLDDAACRRLQEHVPLVSVDSPDARNRIFAGRTVYLRMHGRDSWYDHRYTREELEETATLVRTSGAGHAFIFFNNDHSMLFNAQQMKEMFREG